MKRRAFLQLLVTAPIAAMAPWRPPTFPASYHHVLGPVVLDELAPALTEAQLRYLLEWGRRRRVPRETVELTANHL